MEILVLIGRILFGRFFIMMGINHFMKMMAGYTRSKNVPVPALAVTGAGFGQCLQPCGHVHTIREDIPIPDKDIAQIDAAAEIHMAVAGNLPVALGQFPYECPPRNLPHPPHCQIRPEWRPLRH